VETVRDAALPPALGGSELSMRADQAFLVALTWLVLQIVGPGAGLGAVVAVASVPGRSWRRSEG
jgi:hypothetical protein